MSDEIRRLLLTGGSPAQIRAKAKEEGTTSMWHDGMLKVKAGIYDPLRGAAQCLLYRLELWITIIWAVLKIKNSRGSTR